MGGETESISGKKVHEHQDKVSAFSAVQVSAVPTTT